jgi:hypothetical protein
VGIESGKFSPATQVDETLLILLMKERRDEARVAGVSSRVRQSNVETMI